MSHINSSLEGQAQELLASLPRSVELPAGCGKTELIAALVAAASTLEQRVLVLTHTNAGVEALRRRLNRFRVPKDSYTLNTIASWSYRLSRAYPTIGEYEPARVFEPAESESYVLAATRISGNSAIAEIYRSSFDYFVVDEYQDCTSEQHDLVLEVSSAITKTCVLGDRLQSVFGFGANVCVEWEREVHPSFPSHFIRPISWRWHNQNPALGAWLLQVRDQLLRNETVDLAEADVDGLVWIRPQTYGNPIQPVLDHAFSHGENGDTAAIIAAQPFQLKVPAQGLNGRYVILEEVEGSKSVSFLDAIDFARPAQTATAILDFIKECHIGAGPLNRALRDKLSAGEAVAHLKRPPLGNLQFAFDSVLANCNASTVIAAMTVAESAPSLICFRREAWTDAKRAIEFAETNAAGLSFTEAFRSIRDRAKYVGRNPRGSRIISTTLRIKGLEYDDAIILNVGLLKSRENLYVALTRARKRLVVVSPTSIIWPMN